MSPLKGETKEFKSKVKKILGAGVIGSAAITAIVISSFGPNFSSLFPEVEADTSLSACVAAYWADDPSINSKQGDCSGSTYAPPLSGDEGSDDEESEVEDNSAIVSSFTCGSETITVSKNEFDHSEKNKALKVAGKESEMTPYPGDNWTVIFDPADLGPGFEGAVFTTGGVFSPPFLNATRNGAHSAYYAAGDECHIMSVKDGKLRSDRGIAQYDDFGSMANEYWVKDGAPNRDGDLPNIIRYEDGYPNGIREELYVNNAEADRFHRLAGPAHTKYSKDGSIESQTWSIDDVDITNRDTWISKGGSAEGWDNYSH